MRAFSYIASLILLVPPRAWFCAVVVFFLAVGLTEPNPTKGYFVGGEMPPIDGCHLSGIPNDF